MIADYPIGVWIENADLSYVSNMKRGKNLKLNGFMYSKEASFKTSTNWVCVKGNGKLLTENKCMARCVTRDNGSIKLGKHKHNHPPAIIKNGPN